MFIFLALFILTQIFLVQVNTQKECFSYKSSLAANYSQQGPLKMSLTDPIKDFQTGSYTIINTHPTTKRFTCFNITLLYINTKNSYQVVGCTLFCLTFIAIQNIQSYQDTAGLDFSIRFSASQAIVEGLFIMSQTAQWTSASVHYIISSREDFRVGMFVPEMMQFLPCGREEEELVVSHRLVKDWNASTQLVFGLPFLSGIRTIDTELNITFGRSSFNPTTSVLSIPATFAQVQYPIEYMLISYCIVTMTSDFQIANIYDLNYIPSDINVFVGMTGVRLAPQQSTGLKSASVPLIQVKKRFQQFFSVQGLVIQSSSNLDILFSDGSYQKDDVVQCVTVERCHGYDGYMVYYQNQDGFLFHSECVLCEKYASYNNVTMKCQCRELYVRIGEECVEKDEICSGNGEEYNETKRKCQCASGYVERNGTCVQCPQGYTVFKGNCYKLTKTSDIAPINLTVSQAPSTTTPQQPECPSPSTYNDTIKSCQCQSPTYYDQSTRKCLQCQQNQLFNTKIKQCECMSGSFRINGVCDFCSINGFFNGNGCQCLPGYLGNGKICREDPKFDNGLSASVAAMVKDNGLQDLNVTGTVGVNNLSKENQLTLNEAIVLGTIILD